MNHLILAETQFFAMINGKDNGSTETAYGGFVQEVSNDCSRPTVTVDTMASYTRRAHSGGNGPALRQPRTAQSRAGHSAQEGPYTPQESRSRHASHKASNSHRAPNRKKKNTGKGKHRVLKWVLGIFFSLIGLGLLAGIAVFAYLYTTTEVPQPEKFALAEKTTVYYAVSCLWILKKEKHNFI